MYENRQIEYAVWILIFRYGKYLLGVKRMLVIVARRKLWQDITSLARFKLPSPIQRYVPL